MYARVNIFYGVALAMALVLSSCQTDDPMAEDPATSSATGLAIDFCGATVTTANEAAATRATHDDDTTSRETLELQNSGFCAFASSNSGTNLNLMYKQQVSYATATYPYFTAHWTYSPLKYWPADATTARFYALAPYTDLTTVSADAPGISAIDTVTTASGTRPRATYRLATASVRQNIDLLYATATPTAPQLKLGFQHALARVGILMSTKTAPADGTHILVERITLTTTDAIAITGLFTVSETPLWTVATTEADRTYTIGSNPDDAAVYAYISHDVAFAPTLPARWQSAQGLTTEPANMLTLGDYDSYIYLIPQTETLTFTVTVVYHECNPAANTDTKHTKETTVSLTPTMGRTHNLNIKLSI